MLTIGLTLLIINCVFFARGIYPFSQTPYSMYDFDSKYVPIYFKLWDLLHSTGSIFIDWNLGGGLNTFGTLVQNGLLFPTSWFVGLFSRDFIPYAISFIIMIKLVFISLCSYISFDKLFNKVDGPFKLLFTLLYTFSGWTLFMYSNINYLDVYALFPLVILSYYRLVKDNKWFMYVILISLSMISNSYIGISMLLFIIILTILGGLFLKENNKLKKILRVVLFTLIGVSVSSIVMLPYLNQVINSYKIEGISEVPYLAEMLLKLFYLVPLIIPVIFTIKQLLVKKDKEINRFFIILGGLLLTGIFVPAVSELLNLGIDGGSPFRWSYMIVYTFIVISLYYVNNNYKNKNKFNIINIIGSLLILIFVIVLAVVYREEYLQFNFISSITKYSQAICMLIMLVVQVALVLIVLKNDKKFSKLLLILFTLVQVTYLGIYFTPNNDKEYNSVLSTLDTKDKYQFKSDYNLVDKTQQLNVNFPYIIGVPSRASKSEIPLKEQINFAEMLGFVGLDNFIIADGGNLFINLLMQNRYYLSYDELDERLYELIDRKDDTYLYQSKYNLNHIIPYSGNIVDYDTSYIYDNSNSIYKEFFDKEDNIINVLEKELLTPDNVYYLYSDYGYVNGLIEEDKIKSMFNYLSFDTYISELIVSKDTKIDLSDYEDLTIAYINIDDYIEFVESINKYDVSVEIKGNKKIYNYSTNKKESILIPFNYDESYKVKVNGKDTQYELNAFNMISLDVNEGDNEIVLEYIPRCFKEGIMVSLGSLVVLLIVYFTNKKYKYLD